MLGKAALNGYSVEGPSFVGRRGTEKELEAGIRIAEGAGKDTAYQVAASLCLCLT